MVHAPSCIACDGEKLFLKNRAFLLKYSPKNRLDLAELATPEAKTDLDTFRREGFDF